MASRVTGGASTSQQSSNSQSTNIPQEKIAKRAYEKWCNRGRPSGTDKQDWMEAEAELRAEAARMGQAGSQGTQASQQTARPQTAAPMRR